MLRSAIKKPPSGVTATLVDWIVIRHQPTPGAKVDRGTSVALAVKAPAPKATPTPAPTPTATPTPTPTAASTSGGAAPAGAGGAAKPPKAKAAATPAPFPANLVFASAAGRLYEVTRGATKAAPLTDASCRLETQDVRTLSCAAAAAGRPAWSPDGRSLLALGGPDGTYDQLVTVAAAGDDATRWAAPVVAYSAASVQSAVWVADTRIAVLVSDTPSAPAHLRLLARTHGTFKIVKDFPELTGFELAATATTSRCGAAAATPRTAR